MTLIDKISADLKMDSAYLSGIVARSCFYYRDYSIPKKSGGKRRVAQASPELKTLQYWVLQNILKGLPVSKAAFAYNKGDSIKKHALYHKNSRFLLHADIHNFFPSVHLAHLEPVLRNSSLLTDEMGLDSEESIEIIGKICFRRDCLCIGTVSSPAISNIIMYPFDLAAEEYCESKGYLYSRYADDIYFSSDSHIPSEAVDFLSSELSKYEFQLNRSKTGFYSSKYRRKVTGLILTDDGKVSVGSEMRSNIKKMVYQKLVHGEGVPEQILGYLSFLKDVEPDTYNNIIIKYSRYCDGDIISALSL